MLIPIRCFTCGKVIANKYEKYLEYIGESKEDESKESKESNECQEKQEKQEKMTKEQALNKLGLTRYCCRRILLTHVDDIQENMMKYMDNN